MAEAGGEGWLGDVTSAEQEGSQMAAEGVGVVRGARGCP